MLENKTWVQTADSLVYPDNTFLQANRNSPRIIQQKQTVAGQRKLTIFTIRVKQGLSVLTSMKGFTLFPLNPSQKFPCPLVGGICFKNFSQVFACLLKLTLVCIEHAQVQSRVCVVRIDCKGLQKRFLCHAVGNLPLIAKAQSEMSVSTVRIDLQGMAKGTDGIVYSIQLTVCHAKVKKGTLVFETKGNSLFIVAHLLRMVPCLPVGISQVVVCQPI